MSPLPIILLICAVVAVLLSWWFARALERRNRLGIPKTVFGNASPLLRSVVAVARAFVLGAVIPTAVIAGLMYGAYLVSGDWGEDIVYILALFVSLPVLLISMLTPLFRLFPRNQKKSDQSVTTRSALKE